MIRALLGPNLQEKMGLLKIHAAAISFYFVMSLVPFLVVSATAIDYFSPIDLTSQFSDMLASFIPRTSGLDITSIVTAIKLSSGSGLKTAGFVLAVYTSINFMAMLLGALHLIFDTERPLLPRGMMVRAKSLVLLFIWMNTVVLTAFCFVISVFMQKDIIGALFHSRMASWASQILRDASVFSILLVSFALTYLVVSAKGVSLRLHIQGATIAAFSWIFISYVFAYVLPIVWKQNLLYGALGSLVAILLWAYCCAWAVLIGACWIARFSTEWE